MEEAPVLDPEMRLWLIEQDRQRSMQHAHLRELARPRRPFAATPRRAVGRVLVRAGLWLMPRGTADARATA
jgi:hypothetical protein